jgi:pimeloyl-ACP methyl ester carboxylesterase
VTVVCVHGFGVTGAYFRPFARVLEQPTLVPTLRGWGGTPRPDHVLDLHELADELVGLLDRHRVERAAFVANSFGCQIVVELAIRAPERVEALVLVGPTIDPRSRPLVRFLAMFLTDTLREPLPLWFLIVRDYLRMGPRRIICTGRFAWRHRMEERLPLVQAPTLVVRGARDGFVTQRWCEEAFALLPRGELAVVDGPHAVHYTAPREVARLVDRFLEELRDGARAGGTA